MRSAGTPSDRQMSYASSSRGNAGFALEDRHHQAVRRHLPDVGQQRPGERQRVLLEVVAEREVAEHLEERVMAERRPDVVEIVVLAADAHHLLRRRGARVVALLAAEEQVLELVHAGVGEEQRRIVGRDERRAGDDAVAVLLEVLRKDDRISFEVISFIVEHRLTMRAGRRTGDGHRSSAGPCRERVGLLDDRRSPIASARPTGACARAR